MLKNVLFDLDSTLLPMDEEVFTRAYFGALVQKLSPFGYPKQGLVEAVWSGTAAMVKNDGRESNEAVFWKKFAEIFGEKVYADRALFDGFYEEEFGKMRYTCGYDPAAKETIEKLKSDGYRLGIASNPIFPLLAQETRIRWAGVDPADFFVVTSYENCRFCKPNPAYYVDIAEKFGLRPEETLMVGNNADEDLAAQEAGFGVFLITDRLINAKNKDLSLYPRGGFADLVRFVESQKKKI